jgi:hypothetical protein
MYNCSTVKEAAEVLGTKFQTFLTSNGLAGYSADQERALTFDRLGDIALMIVTTKYMDEDSYRDYTHRIFDVSNGTINLYKSRAFIKRILGYGINADMPMDNGRIYNLMFDIPDGVLHPLTFSNRRAFENYVDTMDNENPIKILVTECRIKLSMIDSKQASFIANFLRSKTDRKMKLGYSFNHLAQWLGYKDWKVLSNILKTKGIAPRIHHGV